MEGQRLAEADEAALQGLRRGWCFGSAEFRRRMLEELEPVEGESAAGGRRQETAINKGDRIVAEELKRLQWTEADLRRCRKSDPEKMRIAARLRRETILSLRSIAARVGLGSSKSANAKLHTWMQANGKPDGASAETKNQKSNAQKTNQTKAFHGHPDFVFPRRRLAVFVDGCFWHACPRHGTHPQNNRDFWREKIARNVARDRLVARTLRGKGWHVLRIWQHELRRKNEIRCVTRLHVALGKAAKAVKKISLL
jgi:DNA mismatch endonuclease Vsr